MGGGAARRHRIRVRGLVQGVGFRPFVWRLAHELGLSGSVANDAGGVLIKIAGSSTQLTKFAVRLHSELPPLARIDSLETTPLSEAVSAGDFTITKSGAGTVTTTIVPDAATCADCCTEIFDPDDRRFAYPFTNCTNCGPRLTITHSLPYDRINTSMASFPMCPSCQREYEDPADRRFHAQPNACPRCGPQVWLADQQGQRLDPPNGISIHAGILAHAADLIKAGQILAIKGLGGFHLACDGANESAVQELRQRKHRFDKPLALMVRDLPMAERYVCLDETARDLLTSPQAPIVLAKKCADGEGMPDGLAPHQTHLGLMLPYTPLHHLLMSQLQAPIVLTSGNMSDEPQLIDNEAARADLAGIADVWLMHDRDIVNRLDDSVVQLVAGLPQTLRRARGYAPQPFVLPKGFLNSPNILALGGELKNTFCLLKNGQAIVSQHIGDLENPVAHKDYRKNLALYQSTNAFEPEYIAVDRHPDYFSTRLGEQMAADVGCSLERVQHHHAHIAACLAEHQVGLDEPPVIGVVFDGLGLGADDQLWGGEFLLADYRSCQRLSHLLPVALPGGELAQIQPWRNSFAHLLAAFGGRGFERDFGDLDCIKYLQTKPLDPMQQMIGQGLNSPLISSAGRLFDAVAGLLDLSADLVSYEGQAAMALQALAEQWPDEKGAYDYKTAAVISWEPLWRGILTDLRNGTERARIAAKFHNMLIDLVSQTAAKIADENQTRKIVLTGGVFQNAVLLGGARGALASKGYTVLSPQQFPTNDGGLSLGQATICAARLGQGS